MIVTAYNIRWDTDGEEIDLPRTVHVELEAEDDEELEDLVSDELSDRTGFCHFGFDLDIVER